MNLQYIILLSLTVISIGKTNPEKVLEEEQPSYLRYLAYFPPTIESNENLAKSIMIRKMLNQISTPNFDMIAPDSFVELFYSIQSTHDVMRMQNFPAGHLKDAVLQVKNSDVFFPGFEFTNMYYIRRQKVSMDNRYIDQVTTGNLYAYKDHGVSNIGVDQLFRQLSKQCQDFFKRGAHSGWAEYELENGTMSRTIFDHYLTEGPGMSQQMDYYVLESYAENNSHYTSNRELLQSLLVLYAPDVRSNSNEQTQYAAFRRDFGERIHFPLYDVAMKSLEKLQLINKVLSIFSLLDKDLYDALQTNIKKNYGPRLYKYKRMIEECFKRYS